MREFVRLPVNVVWKIEIIGPRTIYHVVLGQSPLLRGGLMYQPQPKYLLKLPPSPLLVLIAEQCTAECCFDVLHNFARRTQYNKKSPPRRLNQIQPASSSSGSQMQTNCIRLLGTDKAGLWFVAHVKCTTASWIKWICSHETIMWIECGSHCRLLLCWLSLNEISVP